MSAKRILILWSGGVESTSLLKYLLTNTSDMIIGHHIRMTNPDNRKHYELQAIATLHPLLSKIRNFNTSFSDISICNGKALPNDINTLMFVGSSVLHYEKCDEMYVGCCYEDRNLRYRVDGVYTVVPRPVTWWSDFQSMLQPMLNKDESAAEILPYHETGDWTKKQHMAYLGDLLQHTHSCRRPVNGHECMKCHSCLEKHA